MKNARKKFLLFSLLSLLLWLRLARAADEDAAVKLFSGALEQAAHLIEPLSNQAPRTFTATLKLVKADGLPGDVVGQ